MSHQDKIFFDRIGKKYRNNLILHDITFSIREGEFLTIMGPSGCGKTTLLKMVNLLETPTHGHIYIEDKEIRTFEPIQLRRRIGYAIQNGVLFPNMTVKQNIEFVPSLLLKSEKDKLNFNLNESLDIVKLSPKLIDRYPDELSGGQQQRVSIARALAARPDILLMDEPFSAVDEITREELQSEMIRIHQEMNVTILFVTHDVREALLLGERTLILREGLIEQLGSPDEIVNHPKSDYIQKLLSVNHQNC